MTSLRNRLWLGFGSLLAILLVVSSLTLIVFTRYSHALEDVFRQNYDSARFCDAMKESLDQLNKRAEWMMWDEPGAKKIDLAAVEGLFEYNLQAQLGNVTLPGERDASERLANLWEKYRAHMDAFNATQKGRRQLYETDLLPRYEEMKGVAQHIADMNMSNMVSVDGQAKQTLLRVRNALLILVIAGTLLAAVVVSTANVAILRPLRDLTRSARQIESGNLELSLPVRSRDEIGNLSDAFNSMASRLREFKRIDHDRLIRTQLTTQLAIDSLPDVVFVVGPDDVIEISNDAARRYFGIEPGLSVGSLKLKWLPPLYEAVKTRHRPVEPKGYQSAIQVFVNGHERFLLPRAVPMLSPDQRPLGVTAILVDVTLLRQVDEAKSSLVSTVSHELRTPLTSQRLLLGLLNSTLGPTLAPKQRQMLEVAKADSDRLYRIIDDLLSISRMESGRVQFQFGAVSARDVVQATVESLAQLFADKKLKLEAIVPDNLPAIRADGPSIQSVLTNLLSNALKFTPSQGRVAVNARPANEGVVFSVSDTGPGIPTEFRDRIFEKFFRVPNSSGTWGAGLGLSISKNIIEAHGGEIEFSCPSGGGTVFRFSIPYFSKEAQACAV
ncbi:MAG TPA: ATP-binding protein [Tepidisphaeraceae bacterium]|nr:ATP-binding protein [Tepidisphaeraceae bacterium]